MLDAINSAAALSTSQNKLFAALQALGSGSRINSAADNPAGLAQSQSYSVQLSGDAQAINNLQYGVSLLDTAGGGSDQIAQGLQDIRTLAVQAGDAALSPSDLQAIQGQVGQIVENIDQIAGNTQFNGLNLLDGTQSSLSLQTGANAGETRNLSLANLSSASLGISGIDVTTAAGQASALATLDTAIQQVNDQQTSIGALQSELSATVSNLGAGYENLAAANSQVSDTDYAKSSSDLALAQVQQQAALHALSVYNATQKNLLTLLPK